MNGHAIPSEPMKVPSAQCAGKSKYEQEFPWSAWWVVLSFLSLLALMLTDPIGSRAEQGDVVSGVLESVNLESNTIQIRNSLDQPIFLKLTKPHLLENITPGERVTVVVNEQHEIIKLIETPIPELSPPAGH
ncbi:MAG: hypothetical protein AB7P24_20230 [Nitrospira sp.]